MQLEQAKLPEHVGIIMDGNGRWATRQNKKRVDGHIEGVKTTKKIVHHASKLGIKYLSLYTFSTENWHRAKEEVSFLMNLLVNNLRKEYNFYRENSIKVVHSGNLKGLPPEVQAEISGAEADTVGFTGGLTINLLINYGGRDELIRAINRAKEQQTSLTEANLPNFLDQILPDVDLVIRTAGEQRLSNFMLWQSSYAEYFFSQELWPDFSTENFEEALFHYAQRVRRFGGYNK